MNLAMKGFLFLVIAFGCKSKPAESYCEALCDWAVTCAGTERDLVDAEALTQTCLDTTRASDPSCEKAESGTMDPASAKLLTGCVNDIGDKAATGDCNAFVGTIDDLKTATPPTSCTTQTGDYLATFNDARHSTAETNEELCNRVTATLCDKASTCILGDFNNDIPQAAIDALGGTPAELCVARLDPVITQKCIAGGLYDPETTFDDVNIARQGARECLPTIADESCTAMFSDPPTLQNASCTVMFSSPSDLAAVGNALIGLSSDFANYAQ